MTPARAARSGVTLVELLVALALAAVVTTALVSLLTQVGRATAGVVGRTDRSQRASLAASLLETELQRAGRGLDEPGLRITLRPDSPHGDVLDVHYLAEAYRAQPVEVRASFFAARDSAGRPNLYRDPPDGVRQPWLLRVEAVHVAGAVDASGTRLARGDLVDGDELRAVALRVELTDAGPVHLLAGTRRAGPVGVVRDGGAR